MVNHVFSMGTSMESEVDQSPNLILPATGSFESSRVPGSCLLMENSETISIDETALVSINITNCCIDNSDRSYRICTLWQL